MSEVLKTTEFDQEIRQYDDVSTWLAEVLDGKMRSEFSYTFDGEDLRARDGSALRPIFEGAITAAEELKWKQPELSFEARRRQLEMDEYEDMLAMASGEGPNTMVVVSDFPPELAGATKNIGGYNVTRRQTMLRIITRTEDGRINMVSQSLDRSDREGLEAIYDFMRAPVQHGEMLGQRIYADLDEPFRKNLDKTLTYVYDATLEDREGGVWHAGRSSDDRRNTLDFVRSQNILLNAYLLGPQDEDAQYDLFASMKEQFEGKLIGSSVAEPIKVNTHPPMMVAIYMEQAGRRAALAGEAPSGCGATIVKTAEQELAEAGIGNRSLDKKGSDGEMRCVSCPACKTFHDKVRKDKNGKPVCDNKKCKLAG